jgi:RimJ/RimL family protein N-acetyltransferase
MWEAGPTTKWDGAKVIEHRLVFESGVLVSALDGEDWQVLRALRLSALIGEPEAFVADQDAEGAAGEAQWRQRISDDTWAVARVGGEPIGLMAVSVPDARHAADGWIHSWWVAPSSRGRGVSRAMLDWTFGLGRARHWSRIGLGVWVDNAAAIAAFTAMGFVGQDPRPSSRCAGKHYFAMFRDIPEDQPPTSAASPAVIRSSSS